MTVTACLCLLHFMAESSFSSAKDSSSNTANNECCEQDTSNEACYSNTHYKGYICIAIVCREVIRLYIGQDIQY